MQELLIEILTEELPALPLLNNLDSIKNSWLALLKAKRLESKPSFFYTPRRLVLIHEDFPAKQADSIEKLYGPPVQIAYENNSPSKALDSFIARYNLSLDELSTAKKGDKEVVFVERRIEGLDSKNLIPSLVIEWLEGLNFGKSMRWGLGTHSFIRPIRNILVLLGGELVEFEAYGLRSNNLIKPHRQARLTTDLKATGIRDYLGALEENGVVLDPSRRESLILDSIKDIEARWGLRVEIDIGLLAEVVAITEYPTVLFGRFDEKFLDLPKELISLSMKENQRYFACYKLDSNDLYPGFVMVSNAFMGDYKLILKGNERVLLARLKDALFFYERDRQASLEFGDLGSIGFMEGAGSLRDKVEREKALGLRILSRLEGLGHLEFKSNDLEASLVKSLEYAKRDLLSQTVGEFPELQGLIGAGFAKDLGFSKDECLAIREQYLPHGSNNDLPSRPLSALVNLSIKLDTIFSLFDKGKLPTGSKDPFALRRAAAAILKISARFGLDLGISDLCALCGSEDSKVAYLGVDIGLLEGFITERVYGIFSEANPSLVRAVLKLGLGLSESLHRISALASYLARVDTKALASTFKRVANILEDGFDSKPTPSINEGLLSPAEEALYKGLLAYVASKESKSRGTRLGEIEGFLEAEYLAALEGQLEGLFGLSPLLSAFFDSVLINCEDENLRENRKNLVLLVFREFLEFGDMRELAF